MYLYVAQAIPGLEPHEFIQKCTGDGQGLMVISATLGEARMYRVEVATGKTGVAPHGGIERQGGLDGD